MGGTTTVYMTQGTSGEVIQEMVNGAWSKDYVYLNGELLATESAQIGLHYYHLDHLGSIRVMTTNVGDPYDALDYLPFGEQVAGASDTSHKFTGKERDAESGLDYFGARYYTSSLGRYLSPDWSETPQPVPYADFSDPQTLNLFGYVRNNPLSRADADGHCCDELKKTLSDLGTAAQNTLDHTMIGFLTLVLEPDRAASGIAYSLKAAAVAYGTTNGRAQMAEQMSDPSTARQVIFEAVMTGGIAVAPGASGKGTQIESLGTITPNVPEVPTSIPAGPSARPTAAQQAAINRMGDIHGCHTCGATTPGTRSGNWVGDHQPSNALNPSGGGQVYRPQCLLCSRVQGGQVSATVRAAKAVAAKKPEEH